jgi:nicotinamidase-related amidase
VTFGSLDLGLWLQEENKKNQIESITLIGLCTDICVISNAMLIKACLPEVKIIIDASCCAGVTPQSHETALQAMEACQIEIVR